MEAHLPFRHSPETAFPVTDVRSTLIVSGMQALRSRGLYERYVDSLPHGARERLVSLVAGAWLPIDLAIEHYLAADRLGLEARVIESIGGEVADRINKSVLSVAVQLSKRVGVTPWNALSLAHRISDLSWKGGDIAVWKTGAKEALYE
jgi:hypothetical protein